jgi:putative selenate reductase
MDMGYSRRRKSMSDVMRQVPFGELLERMISEFSLTRSCFSIHEKQFYRHTDKRVSVHAQDCASPVGPAAGPHTQLAQNIITSYLVGGRFIELKTVQKLDTLEIDKPCIDARDEGYNVEWSTEYTLEKAYDEYVKAWVILHLVEELMTGKAIDTPSFIFNMSVGYDLEGIKTEKMQRFIDGMIDASSHPLFISYSRNLEKLIEGGSFLDPLGIEVDYGRLAGISSRISPTISPSVTLSTMHGCPPDEIESICSYMLEEKGLDTFVKLNPTLLGYETVRGILDELGYEYLHLSRESFDHDLQYRDAVDMLKRLRNKARDAGKQFGVKLTNTLGSVNDQGQLPGEQMYMSGRSLYPLSINLASRLSKDFDGRLPISYSGGANAHTIEKIFSTGIHPVTVATDMLKPGGYVRMKQLAQLCESASGWDMDHIDVERLETIAQESLSAEYVRKDFRGEDRVSIEKPLPLFDCYVAPCVSACPIGQDVPEYIYLVGEKRYAEALSVIYEKNALPNITGYICDHQCMFNCTRLDYEGAVEIRELKRIAAENGYEEYLDSWEAPGTSAVQAAVVGAGPAGLSAAYFLARSGFDVTVYEREESAGGVVRHVIPGFRLPESAIEADIDFISRHGVTFEFGVSADRITVDSLKSEGNSYIFYAIGAQEDNEIPLEGDRSRIIESIDFLSAYRKDPSSVSLGARVAVVGGGNTAMDSARAALRIEGVEQVDVLYRRTKKEMPADLEEFDNAVEEGANFRFLTNPESMSEDGRLTCRVMKLGEPDDSGRRRPEPTEETIELTVDTLITAIGEHVDALELKRIGIPVSESGWAVTDDLTLESEREGVYMIGDAHSGPSTVVQCIASARKAVEAALDKELGPEEEEHDHEHDHHHEHDHDHEHDAELDELVDAQLSEIEAEEDAFFEQIRSKKGIIKPAASKKLGDERFGVHEASRCLECSYICNKCVEVCPNRANIAIDLRDAGLFANPFQIVHIDAYCNECGNCAIFCPWDGKPYTDKFTVFSNAEDFEHSENPGMYADGRSLKLRIEGGVRTIETDSEGFIPEGELSEELTALIDALNRDYRHLLVRLES